MYVKSGKKLAKLVDFFVNNCGRGTCRRNFFATFATFTSKIYDFSSPMPHFCRFSGKKKAPHGWVKGLKVRR